MHHAPRTIAREHDVAEQTVYRWIWSGDLACTREGRSIRVSDEDLRRFLASRG